MAERYETAVDLVTGLATAEIAGGSERVLSVGPDQRLFGWRAVEPASDPAPGLPPEPPDRDAVWGIGDLSVVELELDEPRPLTLEFRCAPVRTERPVESLLVLVNGVQAATVSLYASAQEYLLTLDGGAFRAGRNRVAFAYRDAASRPVEASGPAVRWEYIRLRPLGSVPTAVREAGRPMLYLPYGGRVDYALELAAGARLAISGRHFVQGQPAAFERAGDEQRGGLEAELQVAGEPVQRLGRIEDAEEVPLAASRAGLARLSLRALAPPAGGTGGILLVEPRIEVPSASPGPAAAGEAPGAGRERRPNILLYVIDTLRADRLGCYGYPKETSPNIDALAAEALVFDRAVAQSSWTKSAMASVFTGLLPTAHGIQAPEHRLADDLWTLTEMLRDAGYRTAGFAANTYLSESQGFAQGFDDYLMTSVRSPALHEKARVWLADLGDSRPFFLYIHTVEPHGPYAPPEPFRSRFAPGVARDVGSSEQMAAIAGGELAPTARLEAELEALYDAEVASNDAELGRLLGSLKDQGVYDDTLVIFLSDHGEAFFEHGVFGHGNDLYDEVLRVPLLVRLPGGQARRRVAALAQHVDLLPTLAAYLGVPLEARVHGRDLLADLDGGGGTKRIAVSHMDRTGGRPSRPSLGLIRGDWKVIEPLHRPPPPIGALFPGDRLPTARRELYHLGRDPGERRNLAREEPDLARALARLARARSLSLPARSSESADFSPEELRQLQALGYLR